MLTLLGQPVNARVCCCDPTRMQGEPTWGDFWGGLGGWFVCAWGWQSTKAELGFGYSVYVHREGKNQRAQQREWGFFFVLVKGFFLVLCVTCVRLIVC